MKTYLSPVFQNEAINSAHKQKSTVLRKDSWPEDNLAQARALLEKEAEIRLKHDKRQKRSAGIELSSGMDLNQSSTPVSIYELRN